MEASDTTSTPPYFAFKTLTNMLTQMEEHGPPNRVDRSFLTGMSGAGQTQFIHGLKSLGLIADDGTVQPRLTNLVTAADQRPALFGQLVRERYPEAVRLGNGNATTGELVDLFRDKYGVQGDTARKAIAFYLAAAKYAGDVPLSPNFKTPTIRTGAGSSRRRGRPPKPDETPKRTEGGSGVPEGLHPALAGLLQTLPRMGETWTGAERARFMAAFEPVLNIAAPVSDDGDADDEEDYE